MSKKFRYFFFTLVLCASPIAASAATSTSTSTIVSLLEQLVRSLTAELQVLVANRSTVSSTLNQTAAASSIVTPSTVFAIPTSRIQFFTDLYQCILSRQPDANGLAYWVAQPSSMTLGSIYQAWFSSTEYLNQSISNEKFVTQMYNCIHFRQPDQAGYTSYVNVLQSGHTTRTAIINAAIASPEFLTTVGPKLSVATGFALAAAVSKPITSITASNTNITLGQSTNITATFTPGSGDTVVDTAINVVSPGGSETAAKWAGPVNSSALSNPLFYSFTPTAAGVYMFKAYTITKSYPSWQLLGSVTVTVATPISKPTTSISASRTSIAVGQSMTITATYAAGSGDILLNTDIDEVAAGTTAYVNKVYSGSQWGTAVQSSLSYAFTPTAPGIYNFYTFVQTKSYPSWYAVTPATVTVSVGAGSSCGQLVMGGTLSVGQSIVSCNGAYSLVLQSDGNLVLYSASKALWASNTNGTAANALVLQSDGNLVLYAASKGLWSSGTNGDTLTRLVVGDDGNVSLYNGSLLVWYTNTSPMRGPSVDSLNQNDPMSWLIKSLCVTSSGAELAVDPYGGCPAGSMIRKIKVGEGLPYFNFALGATWNAFPFIGLDGHEYSLRATGPYIGSNPALADRNWEYGDGQFDVYGVSISGDGWVSAPNTQDNYSYGGTFFGPNCEVGGGWGLFPATNFLSTGFTHLKAGDIAVYTQNGQSFPGTCPPLVDTIGDGWSYKKNFAFGGVGETTKTMDTIVAYHGFSSGTSFQLHNIMEVFYFTREYGITRYEQWTPIEQHPIKDTHECFNPDTVTYQGQVFVISDCADFSQIAPAPAPFAVPVFPVPNVNLLQYSNFDSAFKASWTGGGPDGQGNPLVWNLRTSSTNYDTRSRGGHGVNYIQLACGDPSRSSSCNPNPWGEFIAQDVPVASFANNATYGYGIAVKTESGSGTIGLTVQELDATKTHVLGYVTKTATVSQTSGHDPNGNSDSVYLPATFVYSTFKLNLAPGTAYLRLVIAPQTPKIYFDVSNAWLAPWPVAGTPQSMIAS